MITLNLFTFKKNIFKKGTVVFVQMQHSFIDRLYCKIASKTQIDIMHVYYRDGAHVIKRERAFRVSGSSLSFPVVSGRGQ